MLSELHVRSSQRRKSFRSLPTRQSKLLEEALAASQPTPSNTPWKAPTTISTWTLGTKEYMNLFHPTLSHFGIEILPCKRSEIADIEQLIQSTYPNVYWWFHTPKTVEAVSRSILVAIAIAEPEEVQDLFAQLAAEGLKSGDASHAILLPQDENVLTISARVHFGTRTGSREGKYEVASLAKLVRTTFHDSTILSISKRALPPVASNRDGIYDFTLGLPKGKTVVDYTTIIDAKSTYEIRHPLVPDPIPVSLSHPACGTCKKLGHDSKHYPSHSCGNCHRQGADAHE